jgi:hypothetical protein
MFCEKLLRASLISAMKSPLIHTQPQKVIDPPHEFLMAQQHLAHHAIKGEDLNLLEFIAW